MEFNNVDFDKPGFDCSYVGFRNRTQHAVVGPGLFRPCSVGNAKPDRRSAMPSQTGASFQPGERVRMRSGGPMMTVDRIKGNQVDCYWTGTDGVPISESFPAAVLQKF